MGVEVWPGAVLAGEPVLEVGGEGVGADAVVDGLPGVVPGWVPPGVEGIQGVGQAGGEAAASGFAALGEEPLAQGEVVVDGVVCGGAVDVGGGVGPGGSESGAFGVAPGVVSAG